MKTAIKFSLGISILNILTWFIFIHIIGIENTFVLKYSGYTNFIIIGAGIFLGIKYTKTNDLNNEMNYGQGILAGLKISMISGILLGIYAYFYFGFINPEYGNKMAELALPIMKDLKLKPDEIAKEITLIKEQYTGQKQFMSSMIGNAVIGLIFSAIFSAFLRNKDTITSVRTENDKL